jgi:hypothetical protein
MLFPTSVGSHACQIKGGGPPPGIVVPGTCWTETETRGSDYIVKFTEVWDARAFHHQDDPSTGDLRYTWSFVVSGSGAIAVQTPFGNFPPQHVF